MRKCIVEPCCGYLKHPLDSGEYESKKIMVIRCVEPNIKQENHILFQKEVKKKGSLHRTVVMIPSVAPFFVGVDFCASKVIK